MLTYNLQNTDEYSFLKSGDQVPYFEWKDETGQNFSSDILRGKYTLIVFFAEECRHCRDNFAYLEKYLFSLGCKNLNVLAIGRDCNEAQIESFHKKYALSFKLTPDPDKLIYSRFAEKAVPRNYLFGLSGELILSIRGYKPTDLDELIRIVSS